MQEKFRRGSIEKEIVSFKTFLKKYVLFIAAMISVGTTAYAGRSLVNHFAEDDEPINRGFSPVFILIHVYLALFPVYALKKMKEYNFALNLGLLHHEEDCPDGIELSSESLTPFHEPTVGHNITNSVALIPRDIKNSRRLAAKRPDDSSLQNFVRKVNDFMDTRTYIPDSEERVELERSDSNIVALVDQRSDDPEPAAVMLSVPSTASTSLASSNFFTAPPILRTETDSPLRQRVSSSASDMSRLGSPR